MPVFTTDNSISYIYRITFKTSKTTKNQSAYISLTTNITRQKKEHKRDVLDLSKDTKFCRYVRENGGWKICKFEVLEVCDPSQDVKDILQSYISKYKPNLNEQKMKEIEPISISTSTNLNKYICICKKSYAHKSSFYKHTNTCLSFQHHKAHKNDDNYILNETDYHQIINDVDEDNSDDKLPTFPTYTTHRRTDLLKISELNNDNESDDIINNMRRIMKADAGAGTGALDKERPKIDSIDVSDSTKLLIEQNEKIKEYIREVITVITKNKKRTDKSLVNSLVFELLDQNKTLQKQIIELSKERNIVVNNTNNNQFNLNFFLNEQCKDAVNLTDFVNSLEITLDDLTYTRNQGLVEGISKVMIDGLKQMDLYKRPIHCTDQKRDTIYIKDNHTWTRDEGNIRIRKAFVDIANKEYFAIKMWMDSNPDWESDSSLQDFHHKMVRNVLHEIQEDPIGERKILKNIEREIFIEK